MVKYSKKICIQQVLKDFDEFSVIPVDKESIIFIKGIPEKYGDNFLVK